MARPEALRALRGLWRRGVVVRHGARLHGGAALPAPLLGPRAVEPAGAGLQLRHGARGGVPRRARRRLAREPAEPRRARARAAVDARRVRRAALRGRARVAHLRRAGAGAGPVPRGQLRLPVAVCVRALPRRGLRERARRRVLDGRRVHERARGHGRALPAARRGVAALRAQRLPAGDGAAGRRRVARRVHVYRADGRGPPRAAGDAPRRGDGARDPDAVAAGGGRGAAAAAGAHRRGQARGRPRAAAAAGLVARALPAGPADLEARRRRLLVPVRGLGHGRLRLPLRLCQRVGASRRPGLRDVEQRAEPLRPVRRLRGGEPRAVGRGEARLHALGPDARLHGLVRAPAVHVVARERRAPAALRAGRARGPRHPPLPRALRAQRHPAAHPALLRQGAPRGPARALRRALGPRQRRGQSRRHGPHRHPPVRLHPRRLVSWHRPLRPSLPL
mmetsp:Transcript_2922/g.9595  ORF Transcript_2922/g.9595 Transcript_2922/m.9595 type:complete len:449 (-) Transcript_2922:9-1355(-)